MVEPFFLAVTRTPSIGPSCPVTWPESPGSACAAMEPRPAVVSATARLAAVDNSTCFIRILDHSFGVCSEQHRDFQPPPGTARVPDGFRCTQPILQAYFLASCVLKYLRSGGRCPFLAGMRRPSALRM